MTIKLTTRIAIQASTAVFAAELLSFIIPFERSYWATLTALFLVSQTWGESIKRAFQRVVMTIIGGVVGTLLYWLLPHDQRIIICVLLIAVFFTVYFMEISYFAATFFITVFVVFLFALIGQWTLVTLQDRIVETCIGAVIAITVSLLVFPVHGSEQLSMLFTDYINDLINFTLKALSEESSSECQKSYLYNRNQLASAQVDLRHQATLSNYELIFSIVNKRKFDFLLEHLSLLTHYVTSLFEVSLEIEISERYRQEYEQARLLTINNLMLLKDTWLIGTSNRSVMQLSSVKQELLAKYSVDIQEEDRVNPKLFANYSYLYHIEKTNEISIKMISFLEAER